MVWGMTGSLSLFVVQANFIYSGYLYLAHATSQCFFSLRGYLFCGYHIFSKIYTLLFHTHLFLEQWKWISETCIFDYTVWFTLWCTGTAEKLAEDVMYKPLNMAQQNGEPLLAQWVGKSLLHLWDTSLQPVLNNILFMVSYDLISQFLRCFSVSDCKSSSIINHMQVSYVQFQDSRNEWMWKYIKVHILQKI